LNRTRIKICGIQNIQDARYAEALGVDTIGLVFVDKSPRSIELDMAMDISHSLNGMMGQVALFYNAQAAEVWRVIEAIPQILLQFHGVETPAFCEQFKRPYMRAFAMGGAGQFNAAEVSAFKSANAMLLDANEVGKIGGTGEAFDWSVIPQILPKPLVLAGGLTPDNVAMAIKTIRPYAVDVSSGVESMRGVKSQALMKEFVNNVRGVDCDNNN